MATRPQDQELVACVAEERAVQSRKALTSTEDEKGRVVPAFGWHPWFSYQLYDDVGASASTYDPTSPDKDAQKRKHYSAVLTPSPDDGFADSLPEPQPLSEFLAATRTRLEKYPLSLVGEVGLDKAFRLPEAWTQAEHSARDTGLTPGGREGRRLSPYHVRLPHQSSILAAQLRLAGELGRAASVHGVQAHGVLFDLLRSLWRGHERDVPSRRKQKLVATGAEDFSDSSDEEEDSEAWRGMPRHGSWNGKGLQEEGRKRVKPKPYPPRICLHSFSGSSQVMKQYLHPEIPVRFFFSFSIVVNLSTAGGENKFPELIRTCPDDRVLVESDVHYAGQDMDGFVEQMYRKICEIKGWTLQEGLDRIKRNYEEFIFG
ncbi:hypothetical protein VTK73DRAFT_10393 [Phialemonium thermophilum]|uniref:Cut9 interacting protein Scn1 n=1 Tax=Phialemonium thermophilum TaxID=223376 RepID=A0ABR3XG43_9PEZI